MPRIIKPVAKGDFTSATLSVDSQGRVISAASGAGAANMETILFRTGPASGNVTLDNNANKVQAFLFAGGGGGGGGGGGNHERGKPGGDGGFGFFTAPATGGSTIAYSIGGGGNGGTGTGGSGPAGNSGSATTFHNFTTNAGSGGPGHPSPNAPGANGNAPGSTGTLSIPILFSDARSEGGAAGAAVANPGENGGAGGIWVLSNEG